MLKRAGEAGSHHVFRRQQRQKTEKADANPRQEPKRCSEEASAHPRRLSGLGGFGKSGPRVLAPPALTLVPAEVAGAVLEAGARRISSLRANGKRASWEFPRQAPCSVPDRAATDPCLSLASLRFGKGRLLKSFSMVPVQRRSTRHTCATYSATRGSLSDNVDFWKPATRQRWRSSNRRQMLSERGRLNGNTRLDCRARSSWHLVYFHSCHLG
jgi:hypothetical protein